MTVVGTVYVFGSGINHEPSDLMTPAVRQGFHNPVKTYWYLLGKDAIISGHVTKVELPED